MMLGLGVVAALLAPGALAAAPRVEAARLWQGPEGTRLVLDLNTSVDYRVFTLSDPYRVVIDISDARLDTRLSKLKLAGTAIVSIQSAMRMNKDLRVVLTMNTPVVPRSVLLKPYQEYGHRLVVDLDRGAPALTPHVPVTAPQAPTQPAPSATMQRPAIVAIDAGHGGEDPGARGQYGTLEKDVALAIAQRVAQAAAKSSGIKAVLIREGDYFIPLRKRMEKARSQQADLFVSIHADAARNTRASGASVYTLSARGASSEAAHWLADKENASDLIGGVSLEDKDDMLASVLLDLAQNATNDASAQLASAVLRQLASVGPRHHEAVQSAAFMVLKSPDVPSILVETAFISNPREERKLRSTNYQDRIAQAVLAGVKSYLEAHPPADTVFAGAFEHVIERGETLNKIAQQYQVSLESLLRENGLKGDFIHPGQVLRIPRGTDG
jgi:N-acetylmuramoyl-L-alanine amidase